MALFPRTAATLLAVASLLLAPPAEAARHKPKTGTSAKPSKATHASKPARTARNRNTPSNVVGAPVYGPSDSVRAFAADVADRRGLDAAWIVKQVAQARRIDSVQKLMMPAPAGTPKDWSAYHDRFVEPRRINAGAAFWQANAAALQRAEERFGVPAEIIVGIIGVETYYGRLNGAFRVIDALATLSFDFPGGRSDRSAFFRSELEEFLVLCARERSAPQALRGSFAGATGLPQFMPGSINRYAIDFDGDGRVDLSGSAADAIGSIANYLAQAGWQRGMAATFDVTPPADDGERAALLAPDIVPTFSAAQMAEHGAVLADPGPLHDGPLALVALQNGEREASYVAGTQNFYAITRYNWSSYYAMAVIALGDAVKRAR